MVFPLNDTLVLKNIDIQRNNSLKMSMSGYMSAYNNKYTTCQSIMQSL